MCINYNIWTHVLIRITTLITGNINADYTNYKISTESKYTNSSVLIIRHRKSTLAQNIG